MYKKFLLLSVLICLYTFLSTTFVQASNANPLVWQPANRISIRDAQLFQFSDTSFILTGTSAGIVEFEGTDPSKFTPAYGKTYRLAFFAPNSTSSLAGFSLWNDVFYKTAGGYIMLASLPQIANFNGATPVKTEKGVLGRGTYLFVPRPNSVKKTTHGFPLEWKMATNTPFVRGVYSVTPYKDPVSGQEYLESDVRRIKPGSSMTSTCMLAQQLSASYTANPKNDTVLICPGKQVSSAIDSIGWDRNHPLSSEVRFDDGGGLVEGGWYYHSPSSGKYYLLYSSGAYDSADEYGGYVGVCDSPVGPCIKVMNESNSEARQFISGSSQNYSAIGRPYPVVNQDGTLADIIFHGRRNSDQAQVVLRCTNFTKDILEQFVTGGRGCEFDTDPTSLDTQMRIVLDYATSSSIAAIHGKGIKLATSQVGTEVKSGEWFPITQNHAYINDPLYIADMHDRATYPGIIVARRNGSVSIGQFGSSTVPGDYEITDGYVEVRNGTLSIATDLASFMEIHKAQNSLYTDTIPPAYDYLNLTNPSVVAFGALLNGPSSDHFRLIVQSDAIPNSVSPGLNMSGTITEDKKTLLLLLLAKVQNLLLQLK